MQTFKITLHLLTCRDRLHIQSVSIVNEKLSYIFLITSYIYQQESSSPDNKLNFRFLFACCASPVTCLHALMLKKVFICSHTACAAAPLFTLCLKLIG